MEAKIAMVKPSSILAAAGLSLALGTVVAASSGLSPRAGADKPGLNVLLVTVDTLRADRVGAYGSKRALTPSMDALAAQSVVFDKAFAHNPVTLPSHANMLLGTTPSHHGVHDNLNFVVREEFLTLAEHLASRGYETGAFIGGFPLVSHFGLDQGFSVYDDSFGQQGAGVPEAGVKSGERRAGEVWASARKWLESRRDRWFLWLHFYDPHDPYDPPEPYRTRFADNLYDGEVAYTDAVLGDVLKVLEERRLDGRTITVCVSDHGESLGEHGEATHGYLAYNSTMWVPFIVRVPGIVPRRVSQTVSHIDIFPTVCDALGIDRPGVLQGQSLLPLMRGKRIAERPVYFESLSTHFNMGWAPLMGFIDRHLKFIDSPRPELYDLERDFGETQDLSARSDIGALRKKLEAIVRSQSSVKAAGAGQVSDRQTREKLRSLGYIASLPGPKRTEFGPEDSVAALLPYHNRAAAALALHKAGKTAEGIGALREVLTARKNISAAYLNLALIYKEERRPAEAIAVLRLGLEAMPENYDIYFQCIADLYESGHYDDVLRIFYEKGFPQVEFDPVIWNWVGLARWKKGDVAEALDALEMSLGVDDGFAVTYDNIGTIHFEAFQKTRRAAHYESALANFAKAAALDPGYAPAFYHLGVLSFDAGDPDTAVRNMERALSLDPSLDEAHFFLGSAHLRLGRKPLAHKHLTLYKSTPTFERLSSTAKKRLEELIAASKPGR